MVSQVQKPRFDPSLFSNRKRYDIFISFHGEEVLEVIEHENKGMSTSTFVNRYLVNAIQSMWKRSGYEGELTLFLDNDGVHDNLDNTILQGISALQVLSGEIL